jgi:hypothetical protein
MLNLVSPPYPGGENSLLVLFLAASPPKTAPVSMFLLPTLWGGGSGRGKINLTAFYLNGIVFRPPVWVEF